MTGDAYVNSNVTFIDLQPGRQIGERSYNTSSTGVQGILSAMTEKQVTAICKKIIPDIQTH